MRPNYDKRICDHKLPFTRLFAAVSLLQGNDITFGRKHTDRQVNRSYKTQVLQDPAITGNSKENRNY